MIFVTTRPVESTTYAGGVARETGTIPVGTKVRVTKRDRHIERALDSDWDEGAQDIVWQETVSLMVIWPDGETAEAASVADWRAAGVEV